MYRNGAPYEIDTDDPVCAARLNGNSSENDDKHINIDIDQDHHNIVSLVPVPPLGKHKPFPKIKFSVSCEGRLVVISNVTNQPSQCVY
jgi:hypothetical protein